MLRVFLKGNYEEAKELYSQSLDILEDHRTYSNRAQCHLNIGKAILAKQKPGWYKAEISTCGKKAVADAGKASTMEPTFAKAYYRNAMGHAMQRDFPRAKHAVKEGLKNCPQEKALKQLLVELDCMGVPDFISNPFLEKASEANARVDAGEPFGVCRCCRNKIPLANMKGECLFCVMDLETDVDEDTIVSFIMNH